MSTRRSFFTTVAATTVYLASPLRLLAESTHRQGIPAFSPAALGAYQQGILNITRFQSLIGSSFRTFLDNDEVVDIVLIKVSTLDAINEAEQLTLPTARRKKVKPPAQGPASQSASAAFIAQFSTGNKNIPQDTYVLDHGTLGSFSALLIPGADNAAMKTCSMIFNYSPAKPTTVSS